MAKNAIELVIRSIGDSPTTRRDDNRIKKILEDEKEKYGIDGCDISDAFHSVAVHSLESD